MPTRWRYLCSDILISANSESIFVDSVGSFHHVHGIGFVKSADEVLFFQRHIFF